MDGRMDGSMDIWTDGWIDGHMDGWMDGYMDGWTYGRMDIWTDGWMVLMNAGRQANAFRQARSHACCQTSSETVEQPISTFGCL